MQKETRMEINHTQFPRCDLIKVAGRIDSYTYPTLYSLLNSLISSGRYNIILDLVAVTHLSSAGLRIMIDMHKICRQSGFGEIVLINLPSRVQETLELTGFLPLYKVFDDQDKAVGYFTG